MRTGILGLELTAALILLRAEGIEPEVTVTAAPKAAAREGTLRVVYASDDGKRLTAACFVDPAAHWCSKE